MKYTSNALNILTALSYKGIGKAWIVRKLKGNESAETIVAFLNETIKEKTDIDIFESKRAGFEKTILHKFESYCDGFIALGDKKFPQHRGNVKDSERPIFLFYKGDIDLLGIENKNITVIGLLNPEGNIEEREREIVDKFVKAGATIISGLALGCDSISHRQALDSNGKTVAILPSPLSNILPAKNRDLAFQIVEEGGLLVTEYGNDFKSPMELSSRYKERDRLQALFCDTIVLAASYSQDSSKHWENLSGKKLDSGARLAMDYAKEYIIPRAVMYDKNIDINNPMFDLNRKIIQEQKDTMVITQDNLSEIVNSIMDKRSSIPNKTPVQDQLL
ncbi:DNA-protecting protein DprA [Acinetobacter junii]|uniref:DNA-processing protein DprA n=1 Tax=Acinetobacter junii TaxID=40215 RepID=UPI001250A6EF|nr:DNA-processing protein DprA [Acinetobacter junii]MCE6004018.1 DNA-protecting protein DprA [Acinetobacter junii]MDH1856862.1 DNA-protecting protein DprA [Acinetobacter junii]